MPSDTYIEAELERFQTSAAHLAADIAQREGAIAGADKDGMDFYVHSRRIKELKGELETLNATISAQTAAIEKMKAKAGKPAPVPAPKQELQPS